MDYLSKFNRVMNDFSYNPNLKKVQQVIIKNTIIIIFYINNN